MADVQIAVIDPEDTQLALAAPAEAVVNVAVPGVQGPIGLTGSVAIAQAGTAATPGIRFESDLNTGIYSPGADQLAVSTGGTERMRLDSSGRLGIGTSSPDALLTVNGIGAFGAGAVTTPSIAATGDLNTGFWFPTADTIAASTGGSEVARIDSSGRLLVGTSVTLGGFGYTPQFQISGSSASTASSLLYGIGTPVFPTFARVNAGSTVVASGDVIYEMRAYGYDGSNQVRAAVISVAVDGTPSANDMPGRLVFSTTADGAGIPTERMRIDNAGTTTITSVATTAPFIAKIGTSEVARIDSSGRLLVGTSSARSNYAGIAPSLQVEGTSDNTSSISVTRNTNAAASAAFVFLGKTRGTAIGANTVVQANDTLGRVIYAGADGTNNVLAASIDAHVDGTPGANDMPGRLVFSVTADGASSPTEALRISNNRAITVSDGGNVVLGTTTGTKIGTATTQKIGFYDATPVVQPTAVADATDAATVITQLNALLTRMRNLGLIAT